MILLQNGIQEVSGSIPLISTNKPQSQGFVVCFYVIDKALAVWLRNQRPALFCFSKGIKKRKSWCKTMPPRAATPSQRSGRSSWSPLPDRLSARSPTWRSGWSSPTRRSWSCKRFDDFLLLFEMTNTGQKPGVGHFGMRKKTRKIMRF